MRIRVIANPTAGQGRGAATLEQALALLRAGGAAMDLRATAARGDAERLAAESTPDVADLVVVAGGDGTINEVVNGLDGRVPVGLLPLGTANVLARELNVPLKDPEATCRLLLEGVPQPLDLGECNGRKFVLMAGIGFDAEAVKEVPPNVKDLIGAPAYVLSGLKALTHSAIRYRIFLPDREVHARGMLLVVANAASYAGPIQLAPLASIEDGLLDVCIFRERNRLAFLGQLINVLLRRQLEDPKFLYERAAHVRIACHPTASVQLDGDYFGRTPVDLRALPAALRVIRGEPPASATTGPSPNDPRGA
jgi:diacylglycerol kinase (ATP)